MTAFTATLTLEQQTELEELLALRQPCSIRESADRPELRFEMREITSTEHRRALLEEFLARHRHTSGLIRVAHAKGTHPLSAINLAQHLVEQGFEVEPFHGGLSSSPARSA